MCLAGPGVVLKGAPHPGPHLREDDDGRLPLSLLLPLQPGQQLGGHRLDLPTAVLHQGPGAQGEGRTLCPLAHHHPTQWESWRVGRPTPAPAPLPASRFLCPTGGPLDARPGPVMG